MIYLLCHLMGLNITSFIQIWIPRHLKQALMIPKRQGSFHVLARSCEVRLLIIDLGQSNCASLFSADKLGWNSLLAEHAFNMPKSTVITYDYYIQ